MREFFEAPPPPPRRPEPDRELPPWIGHPRGVLPGVVPLELVLARTDQVAVCVTRLAGYPTGFEFEVVTLTAPRADFEADPMLFGPQAYRGAGRRGGELPPELLRIGVQFADGSKATNVGGFHHAGDPCHPGDPPKGPVLHSGGGGGGGGDWRQSEWVWPLPPPGRLSFVCEWPAAGIDLTRSDIDAQIVIDAAARAKAIFPDARPEGRVGGSWTSFGQVQSVLKPEPDGE